MRARSVTTTRIESVVSTRADGGALAGLNAYALARLHRCDLKVDGRALEPKLEVGRADDGAGG